jgi:cobyrinic acid a,c-diamide synthase
VARLLGLPVVLVVDASAAARSLAALVHGFATFDPEVRLAGVIATKVGGPAHLETIGAALRAAGAPPLLGALSFDPDVAVAERYLGLHQAREVGAARLDRLADLAARHLDLDRVAALTPEEAAWPLATGGPAEEPAVPVATIGVARDAAFSFYYPANLERLVAAGGEIRVFSPLADPRLPEVDALYLGGGYPELHAEGLAANRPMREAVRAFVRAGRPVYAECGGLLYLGDTLVDARGRSHDMVGALPESVAAMTDRLQDFGYVGVVTTRETPLGPAGLRLRGHRFHCSRLLSPPAGARRAYRLAKPDGAPWGEEGFVTGNVLASYVHLFFDGAPSVAASFVRAARGATRAEAIGRCE